MQFEGVADYILVPINTFAVDNQLTGRCDLWIQYLDDKNQPQSNSVIFGSLFLQNFATYTSYDLGADTATINMALSTQTTMPGLYLGTQAVTDGTDPFTLLYSSTQVLPVNHDLGNYMTTIGANLGYNGQAQFKVSLLGQYNYGWQLNCTTGGGATLHVSCDQAPNYAQLYFNQDIYYAEGATVSYDSSTYAGYTTSGWIYDAAMCLTT